MSENVRPQRLRKTLRKEKIKEMLPHAATHQAIADACGVSVKTIDRDISEWYRSGGMEEWLRKEFFSLHETMKQMDGKEPLAYTTIAQLLGKTLTQKIEAKTEGQQNIIIKVWKPETEPKKGETKNDAKPKGGDSVLPP